MTKLNDLEIKINEGELDMEKKMTDSELKTLKGFQKFVVMLKKEKEKLIEEDSNFEFAQNNINSLIEYTNQIIENKDIKFMNSIDDLKNFMIMTFSEFSYMIFKIRLKETEDFINSGKSISEFEEEPFNLHKYYMMYSILNALCKSLPGHLFKKYEQSILEVLTEYTLEEFSYLYNTVEYECLYLNFDESEEHKWTEFLVKINKATNNEFKQYYIQRDKEEQEKENKRESILEETLKKIKIEKCSVLDGKVTDLSTYFSESYSCKEKINVMLEAIKQNENLLQYIWESYPDFMSSLLKEISEFTMEKSKEIELGIFTKPDITLYTLPVFNKENTEITSIHYDLYFFIEIEPGTVTRLGYFNVSQLNHILDEQGPIDKMLAQYKHFYDMNKY